jgi:hypothetical protein
MMGVLYAGSSCDLGCKLHADVKWITYRAHFGACYVIGIARLLPGVPRPNWRGRLSLCMDDQYKIHSQAG